MGLAPTIRIWSGITSQLECHRLARWIFTFVATNACPRNLLFPIPQRWRCRRCGMGKRGPSCGNSVVAKSVRLHRASRWHLTFRTPRVMFAQILGSRSGPARLCHGSRRAVLCLLAPSIPSIPGRSRNDLTSFYRHRLEMPREASDQPKMCESVAHFGYAT